jgi:hypothetical protein
MHSQYIYGIICFTESNRFREIRGLCDDIYKASSHDVCHHAISMKDEGFLDAEVFEGLSQ